MGAGYLPNKKNVRKSFKHRAWDMFSVNVIICVYGCTTVQVFSEAREQQVSPSVILQLIPLSMGSKLLRMPPSTPGGGTSMYGHTQIYVCSRDSTLPACTGSSLPSWAMSPTQVWSSWNIKWRLCLNRPSAHTLTVVEYCAFCIGCSLRYGCLFVHGAMVPSALDYHENYLCNKSQNTKLAKKMPINQTLVNVLDGDPEYISNKYIALVIKCSDLFVSCEVLIINCKIHLAALCFL